MSATEQAGRVVTIGSLEPVVMELRATTTILGAMMTANRENHQLSDEEDYAWGKLENDLGDLTQRVVDLWQLAFDHSIEKIKQLEAGYEAAIAALKAEKAAPGSKEDAARSDAAWRLLAAAANVAAEHCVKAGYKLEPFGPKATAPEPEPAPQPERLRW